MQFEWDEGKSCHNEKKHGLSFDTACLVFQDPCLVSVLDNRFDYHEERWQSIGQIHDDDVVVYVAHTIYEDNYGEEIIRIISARPAASDEIREYYLYRKSSERAWST